MTQLLQAYLFAWLFWFGVAAGSYAILAIHGLTGGKWGDAIRLPLLAAIRTIPWFAVLFLPVAFGVKLLFPWTAVVRPNTPYLNVPFFLVRAALYFICWSVLSVIAVRRKRVPLPAGSLLLFTVTMTFASWDWMMSLEPKWWSSIYAMNVLAAQALSALAAILFIGSVIRHFEGGFDLDLGNLLLAMLMLWAYLTFSQFLIIWSGNGKSEIAWYLPRVETSWKWLAVAIVVFAFFAPFFVLLFRSAKRSGTILAIVAAAVVVMQAVNLFWTIAPAFHPRGCFVSWADVVLLLAIGGLWAYAVRVHAAGASAQRV